MGSSTKNIPAGLRNNGNASRPRDTTSQNAGPKSASSTMKPSFLIMLKFSSLLLTTVLLAGAIGAAEVTDLGQGLGYLRIHSLAGDAEAMRKSVSGPGSLVLDLRYATLEAASVDALKSALGSRP